MPDTSPVTDRDVFITRAFDAPVATVWKFWTTPELLSQWFGPDGFDTPIDTVAIDLEVGGRWNLSMRDMATGSLYPIDGTITTLTPGEYLEVRLGARTMDDVLENVVLRITFHDHGEKTRVTLQQGPLTEKQKRETAGGWELSFVKLDALLT